MKTLKKERKRKNNVREEKEEHSIPCPTCTFDNKVTNYSNTRSANCQMCKNPLFSKDNSNDLSQRDVRKNGHAHGGNGDCILDNTGSTGSQSAATNGARRRSRRSGGAS